MTEIRPALEAEQSVLGAILLKPEIISEVMQALRPEHFYRRVHQELFRAMVALFSGTWAMDFITVLEDVKKRGIFASDDEAKTYLTQLAEVVPATSNILSYADLVRKNAARREAYEQAVALLDTLEGGDMDKALLEAGQIQTSLAASPKENTYDMESAFMDFYLTLKEDPVFIPTGFQGIDRKAFISPGDFVVVGGRPSSGKTALTLQMAAHMAKTRSVVYFSLETNRIKVMRRLIALERGGSMQELLVQTADLEAVYKAWEKLKPLNLRIVEAAGWTVAQIRAKAIQLGAEVIFLDYMGLIKSEGNSPYERTTNTSRDLHILAQQTGIAVVALSQLKRNGGQAPTMQDLRESGQIEQDADVILLIHRPSEDDESREIDVAKNKEGETGVLRFGFSGAGQRFYAEERRY